MPALTVTAVSIRSARATTGWFIGSAETAGPDSIALTATYSDGREGDAFVGFDLRSVHYVQLKGPTGKQRDLKWGPRHEALLSYLRENAATVLPRLPVTFRRMDDGRVGLFFRPQHHRQRERPMGTGETPRAALLNALRRMTRSASRVRSIAAAILPRLDVTDETAPPPAPEGEGPAAETARHLTPAMRTAIAETQRTLEASPLPGETYRAAERFLDRARQCETDAGAAHWLAECRALLAPAADPVALTCYGVRLHPRRRSGPVYIAMIGRFADGWTFRSPHLPVTGWNGVRAETAQGAEAAALDAVAALDCTAA